jgi:hypothetical protein
MRRSCRVVQLDGPSRVRTHRAWLDRFNLNVDWIERTINLSLQNWLPELNAHRRDLDACEDSAISLFLWPTSRLSYVERFQFEYPGWNVSVDGVGLGLETFCNMLSDFIVPIWNSRWKTH